MKMHTVVIAALLVAGAQAQEICCQAVPSCPALSKQDSTCTDEEIASGKCVESSLCCKTIKCRKESPICCMAMPSCPADTTQDVTCTADEVASGACVKESLCCKTLTCRKNVPAPVIPTPICCQAMPSCPALSKQDSTCTDEEIASGKCVESSMCCKTIKCRKESPICCMAMPSCPVDTTQDSTCTADEVASGACVKASMCCKTLTCRKNVPAPVIPTPICCQAMPSCPAGAKQDSTCTDEEIASGKCVESSMCCKTIKCRIQSPICCLAMPTCPADTTQDVTCTADEVASGACVEASRCCTTLTCRKNIPAPTPICCMAMPSCPSGFIPTDASQCSPLMWYFGICKEASRCCKKLTCVSSLW
eukprot:TRINITY_DN530_c0_g1_i7.p1 TRINITY_DN530_c0_g1~~TRINITY_DN530_c0_g1_i7.p1  ORF type:complete len:363 (+),score=112.52 TRINITY_DN530_c0_g1_i7:70-1158(+)